MDLGRHILQIADRYRADLGFPFIDWVNNAQSFFCLINFWDEVFRAAAGDTASTYTAVQDIRQDPDSPVYFVQNADQTKKIKIWHGLTDTGETDAAFFFGRYPDLDRPDPGGSSYSSTLEGIYVFEVSCDFDPSRLAAAGTMIAEFIAADTSTDAKQLELERSFETRFRSYFPLPELPEFDDEDDDAEG